MKKSSKKNIVSWAKETLNMEAQAILDLVRRLDKSFVRGVDTLFNCQGKVVVTGMGKAGIIGQKFSATLSSTGTPSIWLHPAEAVHGDLGRVLSNDVVVILSYSGETEEIKILLPFLKKIGSKIISLTGNKKSFLSQYSDVVLDVTVNREACPLGLAPTTSTTAMLGLCDAISTVLQKMKGFKEKDFAFYHPKGSLGRKLLLKVEDCMRKGKDNPTIDQDTSVSKTLLDITRARAGAAVIVDKNKKVVGIFTDGDLRRHLGKDPKLPKRKIKEVMTKNPTLVVKDILATEAMRILENKKIDEVPVVDKKGKAVGLLDVQDLLRAGVV
ncbi:MAG: KpsF/GutQ family sugar-phosphate isomerase [Candidatus Omnitrophica bacterium]|nr:KpsF/GutQ family sugar-phosphate isomerase [Candidatus Omnitrophota bacterium]